MKKQKRAFIQLALGALVGATIGFGSVQLIFYVFPKELIRRFFQSSVGPGEAAAQILMGLIALWAALAAHELGHLLTGLAQGFRFHLYVAGFLGVRRHPLTDRVEWYLNRDAQLFGGVAATLPTQQTDSLRQQFAWVVLAGPLTSLFTGGLALWLSYAGLTSPVMPTSVPLRIGLAFGFIFAITSFALFIATTLPNRTGVFYTDRARFFRLIRGGHAALVEQAVLETLAYSMSGRPFGDLDSQQLHLLLTEKEPFFQTYALTLVYYRHLDRNELTDAYQAIRKADELSEDQPQLFRQEIWKELAFAHAFIGQDTALAQEVWQRIKPAPETKPSAQVFLVKAAMALADRDPTDALRHAQHGLSLLPAPSQKAEDKLYARLLDHISQSARQAIDTIRT